MDSPDRLSSNRLPSSPQLGPISRYRHGGRARRLRRVTTEIWMWGALIGFIALMLVLDLFVFHRHAHAVSLREAAIFSSMWIALGLGFGVIIFATAGAETGGEYFAGYLIEKALSVDNVFVFALIFAYFAVPAEYQHRVLFWGVIGALAMRLVFILLGAEALERYDWIVYFFAALLIVTGVRMARHRTHDVDPERNPILRLLRRRVAMTDRYFGQRFWVRTKEVESAGATVDRKPLFGRWVATPLVAVLIAVETSDLIFAVDSIPAIFAITNDTFIVFSSNAFALLGLRALYFLLAGAMQRFVYLQLGLAAVLVFVGAKFIYNDLFGKMPIWVSLPTIAIIIFGSIALSLHKTRRRDGDDDGGPTPTKEAPMSVMTDDRSADRFGTGVTTTEPVRVLVVEDHDLYRRGLVRALHSHPEIHVVGEAPDGWSAEQLIASSRPEVILLDMRLPGLDGIGILERMREQGPHPAPGVLVLSAFTDEDLVWRAMGAGAAGYLDKEATQEEIVDAVLDVARGGVAFTSITAGTMERGFDTA